MPDKSAKYRIKNKEICLKRTRDWRDKNRDRLRVYSMWGNCKDRALKKGIEFSITIEDIVIPSHCPILGIEIKPGFDSGRDNSPSVDRIYLDKGYTPDNIQVISYLANRVKNNATMEQLILIGEWAKRMKRNSCTSTGPTAGETAS